MSELTERMEAIRTGLATMFPRRLVTRNYEDPVNRSDAELSAGVYTILSVAEDGYTNVNGYEAESGQQKFLIIGDVRVAADRPRSEIEDAEFDLVDEIKQFVRNRPDALCLITLESFVQSGCTEHPDGWVVFNLTYRP